MLQPDDNTRSRVLDELYTRALNALDASYLGFRLLLGHGATDILVTHIAARFTDAIADFAQCTWRAASLLIRRTMYADLDASLEIDEDRRSLEEAIAELLRTCESIPVVASSGSPPAGVVEIMDAARLDVDHLLHEVALEECDAELGLGEDRDRPRLAWEFVARDETLIALAPAVFMSAQIAAIEDSLMATEIEADIRWFVRWSTPADDDRAAMATLIRANEWVLADRRSIVSGETAVAALLTPPHVGRLPAKQRMMAEALARSVASLYIVRGRDGDRTTLEDLADGSVSVMHEHQPEADYLVDDFAAGRLYDVGGGRLLRSPGMFFFGLKSESDDPAAEVGPAFRMSLEAAFDSGIAVESALRVVNSDEGGDSPGPMEPPEQSAKAARARLAELRRLLDDAELAEKLDQPLEDFLEALRVQAKGGRA
jgi:hypothetical protein